MKPECTQITKNKRIVFQENRSKLTIVNIDQVKTQKVTVDGCEITTGKKCDFLLLIKELECFIELKGQNINEAVKQIEATIKKLSRDQKKQKKKAYIICTRSPMTSKKIQNLRVLFRKRYNSDLIIKSTPYEDSL